MEEELILVTKIILSVFLGGLIVLLLYLYDSLLVKPKKIRSMLQKQGINEPSPSFLLGNIPDMKRIKFIIDLQQVSLILSSGEKKTVRFCFLVFKNNLIIIMGKKKRKKKIPF